jgi:hypothetical protein
MDPAYGGPPWTGHEGGGEDLRPAGYGTNFCREGMGRVRSLWGSSPAEDLGGRPKYLGQRQSMVAVDYVCASMSCMNHGGRKVAAGEVQVGSGLAISAFCTIGLMGGGQCGKGSRRGRQPLPEKQGKLQGREALAGHVSGGS